MQYEDEKAYLDNLQEFSALRLLAVPSIFSPTVGGYLKDMFSRGAVLFECIICLIPLFNKISYLRRGGDPVDYPRTHILSLWVSTSSRV